MGSGAGVIAMTVAQTTAVEEEDHTPCSCHKDTDYADSEARVRTDYTQDDKDVDDAHEEPDVDTLLDAITEEEGTMDSTNMSELLRTPSIQTNVRFYDLVPR